MRASIPIPERCDVFAQEQLLRIERALPPLDDKQRDLLQAALALAYVQGRQDGIETCGIITQRAFDGVAG